MAEVSNEVEPQADAAAVAQAAGDATPAEPAEMTQLRQQLEAARKRVDDLARAYQASERDREEFKVRMTRERDQMLDVERGKVAVLVIETIDSLDLCLRSADTSPLAQGVKLIRDQLLKQVEATGVERVELTGSKYDPQLAEATDMEITGIEADDGSVVAMSHACYRYKGRIIRPGRVKVARFVKPAEA